MKTTEILLATRAIESPPYEGGYVLLRDIADELSSDGRFSPFMFSATKAPQPGIGTDKVFRKPGWSFLRRYEFMRGLSKKSGSYDIVHTAHIPTAKNVPLILKATTKARASGVKFVQTITGLPYTSIQQDELKKLVWGNHIVCQTSDVYNAVRDFHDHVSLIAPWPSGKRVSPDKTRRNQTRKEHFAGFKKVVLFPGEFDRLGVDESFADCLETLFKQSPETLVVLACRFDSQGRGAALSKRFPGKVISLGETSKIIPLLEAADLVIYPVKKMDSKFNPPLVLTEAMQLGTPVLTSTLIGLNSTVSPLYYASDLKAGWQSFGSDIVKILAEPKAKNGNPKQSPFQSMVDQYVQIYRQLNG